MQPQVQALLQDRRALAIGGGAVLLIVLLIVGLLVFKPGGGSDSKARKLNENERVLATVDNLGRAIEIQALMAREGINMIRTDVEGGKAELRFEESATIDDRDRGFVTLVQSGLMDKNVGLEVFDKGDLTASREEKRIKLIRARNGELARLIRKIDPIQDASVFISMPEPTIFKRDMVPPSATVQVSLPAGDRLGRDKVRSIINLLVGSIENLDAKHVSLTDTNGNVYNSVLDATDELMDKLQERDQYMEQKIRSQLDKLIGTGKYVVTVSTQLREGAKSEMQLSYEPRQSSVAKSSKFSENLNSSQGSSGGGAVGGPVSSMVPSEIETNTASGTSESSSSQRGYNRTGVEMEYNTGKRQITEDHVPGMVEDISIAVTISGNAFPANMTTADLQGLIAHAASPIVRPESVSIVAGQPEDIAPITPVVQDGFSLSNLPWWVWAAAVGGGILLLLLLFAALFKPGGNPQKQAEQDQEIQQLRQIAQTQAQQIQSAQEQTQQMLQQQQQQLAQLASVAQPPALTQQGVDPSLLGAGMATGAVAGQMAPQAQSLKETLSEIHQALATEDDEDVDSQEIKSWIESV